MRDPPPPEGDQGRGAANRAARTAVRVQYVMPGRRVFQTVDHRQNLLILPCGGCIRSRWQGLRGRIGADWGQVGKIQRRCT
jgi:hypothetical protein